jgi:hypothetical protein
MEHELQIRAVVAPWNEGVSFLLKRGDATADPMVMTKRTQGEYREPSFELSIPQAQLLMDDLWVAGLRPTEGTGSAGALAATQKHLEDMRTLVFEKRDK